MPHASQIRSSLGITFAKIAVIGGSILAALLVAAWIATMVLLDRFGSPGYLAIPIAAVILGAFRLNAERRTEQLVAQFPQAFMLHVLVTGAQRTKLLAFAHDAGIDSKIPLFGGRYTLVATEKWLRLYRGAATPSVVIEISIERVTNTNMETKKAFLATQSLLNLELAGPSKTWPAQFIAVFFRTITATAIPEQFYGTELTALKAVTHPSSALPA